MPIVDNQSMSGGARRFAALPESVDFATLRQLVSALPDARILQFIETIPEVLIVFDYHGHQISINNQFGEYWFFARDSATPDRELEELTFYFRRHLPVLNDLASRTHDAWATGGALVIATLGILGISIARPDLGVLVRAVSFVALLIVGRVVLGYLLHRLGQH